MLAFVRLAFVFLAFALACDNDVFTNGDASNDASTEDVIIGDESSPPDDGGSSDATSIPDVQKVDASDRFCEQVANVGAIFCRDFDDPTLVNAYSDWSSATNTPDIALGPGRAGFGAVISGTKVAYLSETSNATNQAVVSFSFDMIIPKEYSVLGTGVVIATFASSSNTMTLSQQNTKLIATGTDGTANSLTVDATSWHTYKFAFDTPTTAHLLIDGTQVEAVPFPQAPTMYEIDLGIQTGGALNGTSITFDNVILR
jgi:hypothetical protein